MNQPIPYPELVQAALAAYALDDAACTFIQHSENVTYKVDAPDGNAFVLRLHLPAQAALGTHGLDPRMVNSEMLWLQALQREVQLPVPRPLPNQQGEFVTQVTLEEGRVVNCTMLQWLEGETYKHEMEDEDTAAQIGVIVGKLHLHASRWRLPSGFKRPARDAAYFEGALAALRPAVDDGRIRYQDFRAFEIAIQTLTTMLGTLTTTRQTVGLLHADLHRGNFIIHNGQIKLIDFSLCAFGNFMFDLGICLADMSPQLHNIMLLNYNRLFPLPVEYKRLIEGFFIGSFVGACAFFADDPNAQETLIRKIPLIAREYTTRFNNDERFWFGQI
jgi:Ser/Thr protein kinase RdoA (MazF antagonist)